jgi:hypothetical protein
MSCTPGIGLGRAWDRPRAVRLPCDTPSIVPCGKASIARGCAGNRGQAIVRNIILAACPNPRRRTRPRRRARPGCNGCAPGRSCCTGCWPRSRRRSPSGKGWDEDTGLLHKLLSPRQVGRFIAPPGFPLPVGQGDLPRQRGEPDRYRGKFPARGKVDPLRAGGGPVPFRLQAPGVRDRPAGQPAWKQGQPASFRPATPARISVRQRIRAALAGSPSTPMPQSAVPTAPIPTQTA